MDIPKLSARAGGTLGLAFAVVGGGIQHVRKHAGDVSSHSAQRNCVPTALVLLRASTNLWLRSYLFSAVSETFLLHLTFLGHLASIRTLKSFSLSQAARAQAEVRALNVLLAQNQQQIQNLLAGVHSTQVGSLQHCMPCICEWGMYWFLIDAPDAFMVSSLSFSFAVTVCEGIMSRQGC